MGVESMTSVQTRAKVEAAQRKLRQVGRAASKFARKSMEEVAAAARASRAPMRSIWRAMAVAGRKIGQDARVAWHEMARHPRAQKHAGAGKAEQPAA
jgi:hypothetical protein